MGRTASDRLHFGHRLALGFRRIRPTTLNMLHQNGGHLGSARLVKQREKYTCQLCGYIGFAMRKGKVRYCEVHHKVHAGRGGTSLFENLVALCATCHRKAQSGNLTDDNRA